MKSTAQVEREAPDVLRRVALKAIGRATRVMDAWIAATAMAHGAAVCTQDADFDAAIPRARRLR